MGNLPQVPARRCWSRRAPSVQNLRQRVPDPRQTGGTSGRKKNSARVIYSNRECPSHPPKKHKPGLDRGPPIPHHITPQKCPTPTRGSTSRHVPVLEALSVWVVVGHSAVSPRRRKLMGQFAKRALEDAPRGQGGHELGIRDSRCLPDVHYPFFPVTVQWAAAEPLALPSPSSHRPHSEPPSQCLPPGVVLKSVPPGVVL